MYVYVVLPLACVIAFLMDEALLSISQTSRGQIVKMLTTPEPQGNLDQIVYSFILILFSCLENLKRRNLRKSQSILN